MPRPGLSSNAKAALVEGYQNPHLLPAGRSLRQRLSDFVFVRAGERYSDQQINHALNSLGNEGVLRLQPRGGANGRGLSDAAKIELREAFNNRAQLGFPAAGRAFWNALAAHVQARAPSDPPITGSQVENAVGYMRRNNQLGMPPVQLAHEGSPDPYEPVAAPDGEERPIVLQHQDIMFSGADHGVVPNDQVIYDPQTHEYVDLHGRTVTPHWLDGEFF